MKLPGLQKYLSQNLGYPVSEVQTYRGMTGDGVVDAPAFKENLLSYAVCYGLVLQGLNKSKLSTNLLPKEIVTDRLIRDKKPWAVAMAAALLLGCSINFFGQWRAWNSVADAKFKAPLSQATDAESTAARFKSDYDSAKSAFDQTKVVGEGLVGNVDGRLVWLELLKAVDQCLPTDPPDKRPDDIMDRDEVHIDQLECEWYADLSTWYMAGVAERIRNLQGPASPPATGDAATPPAEAAAPRRHHRPPRRQPLRSQKRSSSSKGSTAGSPQLRSLPPSCQRQSRFSPATIRDPRGQVG